MEIQSLSLEVHQAKGPVVWTKRADIEFLKQQAAQSARGRSRICAHPGPDDRTHEMLVALRRDNYIHPHLHPGKVESFHVIEGLITVVIFEEDGRVSEVIPMGDFASGRPFYYRQTKPVFHTQIPESDFVVFQEVTQGPMTRDTVLAPWAPPEGPDGKLQAYIEALMKRVQTGHRG